MTEIRLQRLNTVWFHLYDILEKQPIEKDKRIEVKGWGKVDYKEQLKGILGAVTVLYLDCGSYTALCIVKNSAQQKELISFHVNEK